MGQYSTAVWGGLAILIVINLARIHTVNSYYETPICYNDPSAKYKGSRLTCYEFVLEYAFVLLNFLSMYILLLLKASCTYLIRVLKRSMTEEGVPADRHGYRIVLGLWAQEEKMKQLRAANKDKDNINSNNLGGGVATTVGGKKIRDGKLNEESGGGADAEGDTSEPEDKLLSDMASVLAEGGGRKRATLTLRELNRITEEEEQEIEEEIRFAPPIRRPFLMLHNYLFRQRGTTLVELFLGHSPAIYFGAVELAVLLQNFYIAMWASNLAFFAKNSRYKISWEASMIVWTIFNQIILRRVLLISSYIKALYKLDESFADQAVEESQVEEVAFDRLATETYSQLRKKGIPMRRWRKHLSDLFNDIDRRSTGTLTRTQFRSFLVESGVYFATENVDYLFSLLETPQKKGRVLYKDLFTTLFPELRDTASSSSSAAATGATAAGATISVATKKGDDSTHASENYGWPVDEISMVTL
jgi:Ca2+-binding EF-hand superfamily protein